MFRVISKRPFLLLQVKKPIPLKPYFLLNLHTCFAESPVLKRWQETLFAHVLRED